MKRHAIPMVPPARESELAWLLAELAADPVAVEDDAAGMIACRLLDSAGVSLAAFDAPAVAAARRQAAARASPAGATLIGARSTLRVPAEWAAWANSAALRQHDMNDMFVGAEYAHPSDSIPGLLAVAQQHGCAGRDLVRAIATAYEIHIALARSICLYRHGLEPVGHLGPALAGGIGTLLGLPVETIYQAIQHAVQLSCTPRRMPESVRSDWRVIGAAHAAKTAVELVERASHGLTAPSPTYESPQGIVARFLGGSKVSWTVELPERGEPKRAVFASFPKAHRAQYQSQAFIDLAIRLASRIGDPAAIARIEVRTSAHLHEVTGTGWQAGAVPAPRPEHDLALILATALEDGAWSGESLAERAARPSTAALRSRIATGPDAQWSERSHAADPAIQSFGGTVTITWPDGRRLVESVERSDCHALSPKPWCAADYAARFRRVCPPAARDAFIAACLGVTDLDAAGLAELNLTLP